MNTRQKHNEAAKVLLEIADAASKWWRSKRPIGWRLKKHLETPAINTTTLTERRVALAVAKWKRLGG